VQAAFWFRKAAEQGNTYAQSELGQAYAKGEGVPQDYAQALIWLRKAADKGDIDAEYGLGQLYLDGHGVAQDEVQAEFWLRKAADRGQGYAIRALAELPKRLGKKAN
jgi:TPR repeat protein